MVESSLTRGFERTSRRSDTVTATEPGMRPPGAVTGSGVGVGVGAIVAVGGGVGEAIAAADGLADGGVCPHPATRTTRTMQASRLDRGDVLGAIPFAFISTPAGGPSGQVRA